MPYKRKQKLYNLTGGELKGEGGFGCVYDLQDLKTLQDYDGTITPFCPESCDIFMNEDKKVVKLFVDESSFLNEIDQLQEMKDNLGDTFVEIFPNFYEYGSVEFKKILPDKFFQCKKFSRLPLGNPDQPVKLYFIVFDKLKMSLADVLFKPNSNTTISVEDFTKNIGDLIKRMKLLHKKDYIHCDVKPDNILMTETGILYFNDLGHTKSKKLILKDRHRFVRTPSYTLDLNKLNSRSKSNENVKYFPEIFNELKSELSSCHKVVLKNILEYPLDLYFKKVQAAFLELNIVSRKHFCEIIDQFALAVTILDFYKYYKFEKNIPNNQLIELKTYVKELMTKIDKIDISKIDVQDNAVRTNTMANEESECKKYTIDVPRQVNSTTRNMFKAIGINTGYNQQYAHNNIPRDYAQIGRQFGF